MGKHTTADTGFSSMRTAQWADFKGFFQAGTNTYSTGSFAYAHLNFEMTRIQKYWINAGIIPAIMFVFIAYCGFWIDPAAAPGRIALSIICVLITLTSSLRISSFMPLVAYHVWMESYLLGCIVFNLVAVVAYALVNYGRVASAAAAKQKSQVEDPPPTPALPGTKYDCDDLRDRRRKPADCQSRCTRRLARMVYLDWHMRWIFPVSFLVYNIVMFSIIDDFEPVTKD